MTVSGKDSAARPAPRDQLFVNQERTRLVRIWADGTVEIAERKHPNHVWGPPTYLYEERY